MADLLSQLRTSIADRYEIERELGRGGMATVYLARDLKHPRRVALKVLLADLAVALGPERFRREIQLATQLSHPHILPLYDSGEVNGQLYYVMPYVEGESLRARLDRERQLPVSEALRIACEIASALEHAHQRGIIHRDIKPENILLEDGQALVADFGIARAVSAVGEQKLTQTGVSLGTPAYMSPEQAMAERNLDGRTDIYSLGCVLYEMLAGSPPFTGPTAQAVIARHALDEVPSLTIVRGTIPEEVEDIVLCALAKVPADRFATAGEFAQALEQSRQTSTHRVTRPTRRTATRRAARVRNRRVLVALVAGAVIALPAFGWAGWRWMSDSRSTAGALGFERERIAVRYFVDRSPGGQLGYLADGLTESLIERLAAVAALRVISPNGVAPFRDSTVDARDIGNALAVGSVVEGDVERLDSTRVRVTLRLMDGNSGAQFRDVSIIQSLRDPLTLRDTLAERAALFLREWVGQAVRISELRSGTRDSEAWSLVQVAERLRKDADERQHAGNLAGVMQALARADSALAAAEELDPRWIEPVILRGRVAAKRAGLTARPQELRQIRESGIDHVNRALAMDEQSADARYVRAALTIIPIVRNIAATEQERATIVTSAEDDLRNAISVDRNHADALDLLSALMYESSNLDEASLLALRAYEADAYLAAAPRTMWRLYTTAYDRGNFQQAEEWCTRGKRRFAHQVEFARCDVWMMATKFVSPNADSAWARAAALVRTASPHDSAYYAREGQIVAAAVIGRAAADSPDSARRSALLDSARRVLLRARADHEIDPEGTLVGYEAFARTVLGDRAEAIRLLERYLTEHPTHRRGFAQMTHWWWRDLQSEPRFKALVPPGG
jgi:serine/threonine-protein kinase